MERVQGWDTRLAVFEREVLGEPFRWGAVDCHGLVRGVWTALYGDEDALPEVRAYDSRFGALRAHVETGGIEASLRELGAGEVGISYAQRGDVVLETDEDDPLAGVAVVTSRYALYAPEGGEVERVAVRNLRVADDGTLTTLRLP